EFGILDSDNEDSAVIMGNIAYPFTVNEFEDSKFKLDSDVQRLVNWGIHLYVPIGAVQVAANREKLTYKDATRLRIKTILDDAINVARKEARKLLDDVTNIWDARVHLAKVKSSVLYTLANIENGLEWNDTIITEALAVSEVPEADRPTLQKLSFTD